MTIRSSLYFTFNGERSDDYKIYNVNMEMGMQSEPFASERKILEQRTRGRDRGFFQEIQRSALEFTVSFAFYETWDDDLIRRTARWLLSPSYYAPMTFIDDDGNDLDKVYYCLCVDSPELVHNCLKQGYIKLKFVCVDAYVYTKTYNDIIDLSSNSVNGTVYTFNNFGDTFCQPLIEIYKFGDGDVNFYNQSYGNAEMTFIDLADEETVTIDCEARKIETDIPLTNRYDNLVGDYLNLPIDYNYILIKGNCKIRFTYQLKRIQ